MRPSLVFLFGVLPFTLTAQGAVRGIAYDSLRGQPLAGAFVTLVERSRSAMSDEHGNFHFDSLASGTYTIAVQHDSLDSIGLSGLTRRVAIADGATSDVSLSIPAFESMWRSACGSRPAPRDSGFVYGTVRDGATRRPRPEALVTVSWVELTADKSLSMKQRRLTYQATADESGGFVICGAPNDVPLQLRANADEQRSGTISVEPFAARVRRIDVMMGTAGTVATTQLGVVKGHIAEVSGAPFPNARVAVDGTAEVRSDGRGDFTVRGVPVGTRQVEILALGMRPIIRSVDVSVSDTAFISAQLDKMTMLDTVRIRARTAQTMLANGFDERRRTQFGQFRDSTTLGKHQTMSGIFGEFATLRYAGTRTKPGLTMPSIDPKKTCAPRLYVDGVYQRFHDVLSDIYPDQLAAVEVYTRGMTTPMEYSSAGATCGAVVVWTKRAFP